MLEVVESSRDISKLHLLVQLTKRGGRCAAATALIDRSLDQVHHDVGGVGVDWLSAWLAWLVAAAVVGGCGDWLCIVGSPVIPTVRVCPSIRLRSLPL